MVTQGDNAPPAEAKETGERAALHRAAALHEDERRIQIGRESDRLFAALHLTCGAVAVALALFVAPQAWSGRVPALPIGVGAVLLYGGALCVPICVLARLRPGGAPTRHAVAIAQMLWPGLLVHLAGGRLDAHLLAFASLALLALYRDGRVLLTATAVVAADLLCSGRLAPGALHGVADFDGRGLAAFAFGVTVLDAALLFAIGEARRRERARALERAELEAWVAHLEQRVAESAKELAAVRGPAGPDLQQVQKLESIGRLAAGIAHEINTPVQFVSDSVQFVQDAVKDLLALIGELGAVRRAVLEHAPAEAPARAAAAAEESLDLPYLVENLPKALARALDGLGRVATIARSMKEFTHPDPKEKALVDLNASIQSTLTIARNEYKYVADVETDLGAIPPVMGHAGELNQALLNLVVNAAHAIADAVRGSGRKGRIRVRTRADGDAVVISISDDGTGIPDEVRDRVFEPFFTTKEVGRGTGQGLAIARSVVVGKHGGELTFDTATGRGTTFFVRLPVQRVVAPLAEALP